MRTTNGGGLLSRAIRTTLAVALASTGLVALQQRQPTEAAAATPMITMGEFTAAMVPTYPGQVNPPGTTGNNTGVPNDGSINCLRTATVTGGATSAGGVMVGNGSQSYLSHGTPYYGACPTSATANVTAQSSIGFSPMAPTEAPAGEAFLLGQVSHQNWVIAGGRKDGAAGSSYLYGDLKVNFDGQGTDSFSWNLEETTNSGGIEKDADGNTLYWWEELVNGKYTYTLKTTPQYAGDQPAPKTVRNASGQILYNHWAYSSCAYRDYYGYCVGDWVITGRYPTPDPDAANDPYWFDPVVDPNGYVDDHTKFSDVRSTKIFTVEGGMPYRLVIRGFTPSDGTCPATPPSGEVTQVFDTKENQVTYGCLYASWEQERPMVMEKEAQKAPATASATIPTFNYTQSPTGVLPSLALTPTAYNPATGLPSNTQNGVARTENSMLVPIDGVVITENTPPSGWKLTNVQCVQGPAAVDPADPTKFVPEPITDWNDRTKYPEVLTKDGKPIPVDPATGKVDLSSVSMAASTDTLAITCRYVNQYGANPPLSVAKTAAPDQDPTIDGNQTTARRNADGTYTLTYNVTVSNPYGQPQDHTAITDTPQLPAGMAIKGVTVNGTAVSPTPTNNNAFTVATSGTVPAGTIQADGTLKPGTLTYSVEITATMDPGTFVPSTGICTNGGVGAPNQGGYNVVAMNGDTDGTENNDACVEVTPESGFAVAKSTTDGPVTLTPGQTELVRNYTVTVTNTASAVGTSPAVTDIPSAPAGFTITKVTVDGVEVQKDATGAYPVTAGDQLKGGESKAHAVVVTYAVDQANITDWVSLGQCAAEGTTPDADMGLYNVVNMDGDSDGVDNNDVCNPVTGTPQFSVDKTTSQAPIVLAKDATTATVTYTVTVKNTGNVEGTSAQVVDVPATPAGFTVASVTVDGGAAQTSAPFVVTQGDLLPKGQSKVHTVVVAYTIDQAAVTGWTNLGTCDASDATPDSTKGLYNLVTMDGDTDGAENNDACVEVTPAKDFAVEKTTTGGPITLAEGQTSISRSYTVTVTNTGRDVGTSPAVTDTPSVPNGFTITSVTVDGTPVTATNGVYPVTAGDQLAAGAKKAHTVVVTYAVDPSVMTGEDWSALGTCQAGAGSSDPAKGLYNVVSMPGDSDGTDNNDACNPVTGTPSIKIIKKINGDDANTAPGVSVIEGSTMTVTFEVTNTGNQPLTNVKVTDDKVPAASITCPATELAPGKTMICTADLAAPKPGVQHTNTGTATGEPPAPEGGTPPPPVKDDDPGNAKVPSEPSLTLEKRINGFDADSSETAVVVKPGELMDITFVVTNTGNVELTDVKVTDDKVAASAITCPKTTLAAGESMTCTAQIKAPEAKDGEHVNVATAEGTPPEDPNNPGGDNPPVETPPDEGHAKVPSLKIIKKINGDDANTAPGVSVAPGSDMLITYEVTNDGQTVLTDVKVADKVTTDGDKPVQGITCPKTTLAVGETMTCTATIKAPAEGGMQHTNVAKAIGTPEDPNNPDTPPVESPEDPGNGFTPKTPALAMEKKINGYDADDEDHAVVVKAGSDMLVTFVVTNTGNQTLKDVKVSDSTIDSSLIKAPANKATQDGTLVPFDGSLAPGETAVFTATIKAPEAAGGVHKNVGVAQGTPPGDNPPPVLTPPDEGHAKVPSLKIIKKINGEDANEAPGVEVQPGSDMEITYEVTNDGPVDLTDVKVADKVTTDGDKPVQGITCPKTALVAGETMTCTATIKAPAFGGVQHTNVAKATGTPPTPPTVPPTKPGEPEYPTPDNPPVESPEDPGNAHTPKKPALSLEKKINGLDADADSPVVVKEGSQLAITFVVTNTGNQTLTDVKVSDNKIPASQIKAPAQKATADGTLVPFTGSLEPGEIAVFTASIKAPKAGGEHVNVGIAEGTPPKDGDNPPPPVKTPPDEGHALVPSLKIIKRINGDDANTSPGVSVKPGSTMNVTFEVINNGKVDLTSVKVSDSVIKTGITCGTAGDTIPSLKAGESVICSAKIKAPKVGTIHHNVAKAEGTPPENPTPDKPVPGEPEYPPTENPKVTSPEDPAYAHPGKPTPPPPTPKMPKTGN